MPAKTNSQHPDRVIRQTEKIAAEIEPILNHLALLHYGTYTGEERAEEYQKAIDQLATYVIDYRERDWYEGWKTGFQAAKEGKSLKDEEARLQIPDGHTAK